tara:strand:- start:283 stop:873 length:591 start_codon:yes stop_codon:yes gene_type:complete
MREVFYDYGSEGYTGGEGNPSGGGGSGRTSNVGTTDYQTPAGGTYDPFNTQSYLDDLNVTVHEDIRGFLPGTQGIETAYNRMLDDQAFYRDDLSQNIGAMRTQGIGQMSKIAGGQGLMSGMGGGFGAKQSGIIKDIGQVRSAYSQDMAGGLLNFQRDMQRSEYGFEDAQTKYSDDLINRLIQLQGMYEDEDYITFG